MHTMDLEKKSKPFVGWYDSFIPKKYVKPHSAV